VHLFCGEAGEPGAPLAAWYHEIGITDVWIYPLKGAFPQDQLPESQRTVADMEQAGTLDAYRKHSVRYWWFERPVPDYAYETRKSAEAPARNIWDSTPETEAFWASVCEKVAAIYPTARAAGFEGIVFDGEAYYSFKGDESGREKPWVWGGHADQYGKEGNYYRRGLQVGRAIQAVWPKAKVIFVYAFGYPGERWWYQGFHDAGIEVFLGPEHTYGAGPEEPGEQWYQSWWKGKKTKATCDDKRIVFPFIHDDQHIIAGLFPINFGTKKANYRATYFREQAAGAAQDDPAGPIPIWIWPEGPFTPQSWTDIEYAESDTANDYLQVLQDFSQAFPAPSATQP
jgi:hypothetical protein